MGRIYVLAGVNGAGKSSIGGAMFRESNVDYFNPDEAAQKVRAIHPHIGIEEANGIAWQLGLRLLEKAIAQDLDFAFETTLGGKTITQLLVRAAQAGTEIFIWYAGLEKVELHLARVRARVTKGGHDIPEQDIRRRWDQSRENLIRLLPWAAEIRIFDNSVEADPSAGKQPRPRLILEITHGQIGNPRDLSKTPTWAKPIAAAAMKLGS